MNKLIHSLASLKLAVAVLLLLLLGLAAGTILESTQGVEVAGRVVYYSWWFIALQAFFAAEVLASIAKLYPWGRPRVGFLVMHGGLVVILAGAVTSYFLKREGQLGLWEGQSGNEVVNVDRAGRLLDRVTLPFSIRLVDFRIDHYPGTMRPANFTSDVEVLADGKARPASIWMNHPLEVEGWTFFQSSYQQQGGREATILSVSRDPGQNVVFLGYGLLVIGMLIVLGTRISQAKADARARAAAATATKRGLGIVAGVVLALAAGGSARADDIADRVARLPVQHDGRVMPLDTLAREGVWHVTGRRAWKGEPPVLTVTRWMAEREAAAREPVVLVGSADIAVAANLPRGTTHASFDQLVGSRAVLELMDRARQAAAQEQPRRGALADAEKLEARLVWLQRFMNRELVRSIPAGGPRETRWNVAPLFDAQGLAALASGPRPAGWPEASAIDGEITYNRVRPTRVAWIVLAIALVASIAALRRPGRLLDGISLAGLAAGFAVMTWGIGARWSAGDRIPAANMYESLLFLAWGVGLFAVVAFAVMRNRLVVMNANAMAALTMGLADLLPMDSFIHPVPPVLAGTPWLAIHVPIIMVSYSVLALGVVVAHLQIGYTVFAPRREDQIKRMNDLLYWYMHVGSILLIVGILTGSIWAADSWGRYWGWDPKEVWSLVAFLAYMAILHGRWEKLIGPFGVAAFSIVAFQTILMTYLGVNYVLGTGLHSYGFGDSPVMTWMIIVAAVETAFLAWGLVAYRRQGRASGARLAA